MNMERCFDDKVLEGFLDPRAGFEPTPTQCEAVKGACQAWERLIMHAGGLSWESPQFLKLRGDMSKEIRDSLASLPEDEYRQLFVTDETDKWHRCLFDQALDASVLELSGRLGDEHRGVLYYTSDRDYWEKYKEKVREQQNLN